MAKRGASGSFKHKETFQTRFVRNWRHLDLSKKLGVGDEYPRSRSGYAPAEDHFRKYAAHGFVAPLPFDTPTEQYGSMLQQRQGICTAFQKFREKRVKEVERSTTSVNTPRRNRLEDFLHHHVKNSGGEQKKKWMHDFSSNKDLSELMDNVPLHSHKPKGSNSPLLDQLSEYQPPLSRASWYVKVIFLYAELKQPKRKGSRDTMRRTRSVAWTTQLIEYLTMKIRKTEEKFSRTGNRSSSGTQQAAYTNRKKWQYVSRLTRWQFEEGLLVDNLVDSLIVMLRDMQEQKKADRIPVRALAPDDCCAVAGLVLQYMHEIAQSPRHIQMLIHACLHNLTKLRSIQGVGDGNHLNFAQAPIPAHSLGTEKASRVVNRQSGTFVFHEKLRRLLCDMLKFVARAAPDTMVCLQVRQQVRQQNNSALRSSRKAKGTHRSSTSSTSSQTTSDPTNIGIGIWLENWPDDDNLSEHDGRHRSVKQWVAYRIDRLRKLVIPVELHPAGQSSLAAVLAALDACDVYRLAMDTEFQKLYEQIFTDEDGIDTNEVLFLLLEWAVTAQRGGLYRDLLVLRLLEKYCKDHKTPQNEQQQTQESMVAFVLQPIVWQFLMEFRPTCQEELQKVAAMLTLLVRSGLFSPLHYANTLLSLGVRLTQAPSLVDCPASDRLFFYLRQLPVISGSEDAKKVDFVLRRFGCMDNPESDDGITCDTQAEKRSPLQVPIDTELAAVRVYGLRQGLEPAAMPRAWAKLLYCACSMDKTLANEFLHWLLPQLAGVVGRDRKGHEDNISPLLIAATSIATTCPVELIVAALRQTAHVVRACDLWSLLQLLQWLLVHSVPKVTATVVIPLIESHALAFICGPSGLFPSLMRAFVKRGDYWPLTGDGEASGGGSALKAWNRNIAQCYMRLQRVSSSDPAEQGWPQLEEWKRTQTNEQVVPLELRTEDSGCRSSSKETGSSGAANQSRLSNQEIQKMVLDVVAQSTTADLTFLKCATCSSGSTLGAGMRKLHCAYEEIMCICLTHWVEASGAHGRSASAAPTDSRVTDGGGVVGIPAAIHDCAYILREVTEHLTPSEGHSSDAGKLDFGYPLSDSLCCWLRRSALPAFATGTVLSLQGYLKAIKTDDVTALCADPSVVNGAVKPISQALLAMLVALVAAGVLPLDDLFEKVFTPLFSEPSVDNQVVNLSLYLLREIFSNASGSSLSSAQVSKKGERAKLDLAEVHSTLQPLINQQISFPQVAQLVLQLHSLTRSQPNKTRSLAQAALNNVAGHCEVREVLLSNSTEFYKSYLTKCHAEASKDLILQLLHFNKEPTQASSSRSSLRRQVAGIIEDVNKWTVLRSSWLQLQVLADDFSDAVSDGGTSDSDQSVWQLAADCMLRGVSRNVSKKAAQARGFTFAQLATHTYFTRDRKGNTHALLGGAKFMSAVIEQAGYALDRDMDYRCAVWRGEREGEDGISSCESFHTLLWPCLVTGLKIAHKEGSDSQGASKNTERGTGMVVAEGDEAEEARDVKILRKRLDGLIGRIICHLERSVAAAPSLALYSLNDKDIRCFCDAVDLRLKLLPCLSHIVRAHPRFRELSLTLARLLTPPLVAVPSFRIDMDVDDDRCSSFDDRVSLVLDVLHYLCCEFSEVEITMLTAHVHPDCMQRVRRLCKKQRNISKSQDMPRLPVQKPAEVDPWTVLEQISDVAIEEALLRTCKVVPKRMKLW